MKKIGLGNTRFIVSNGFDSQSLTPGTVVSDFQIDQAKQNIKYAGSIDDGIRVVKKCFRNYLKEKILESFIQN